MPYQPDLYGAVFPQGMGAPMPRLGSMAGMSMGPDGMGTRRTTTTGTTTGTDPALMALARLGSKAAKPYLRPYLADAKQYLGINDLQQALGLRPTGMVPSLSGGNQSVLPLDLSGGEAPSGIWGLWDQGLASLPSSPSPATGMGHLATDFGVQGAADAAAASAAQNAAMEFGGELGGAAAMGGAEAAGSSGASTAAGSGMLGSLTNAGAGAVGTYTGGLVGNELGVSQGWGSTLGGTAGTAVGGFFGGPAGAAGGGFTGSLVGGAQEDLFREDPALGVASLLDPTWLLLGQMFR